MSESDICRCQILTSKYGPHAERVRYSYFCIYRLCRVLLLIDGKVGLTDTDLIGIEMMEEFKRPYAVS